MTVRTYLPRIIKYTLRILFLHSVTVKWKFLVDYICARSKNNHQNSDLQLSFIEELRGLGEDFFLQLDINRNIHSLSERM